MLRAVQRSLDIRKRQLVSGTVRPTGRCILPRVFAARLTPDYAVMKGSQTAQPYGPQTPLVRAFLQKLAAQPALVWLAAARRYEAIAATPAGRQADRGLGGAIQRSAREEARDALIGPILQMAKRAADSAALDSSDSQEVERLAEPALAAALALVVADRIGEAQRELLTSAFGPAIPAEAAATSSPDEASQPTSGSTPDSSPLAEEENPR